MDWHSLFSLNYYVEALSQHTNPLEVWSGRWISSVSGPGWWRAGLW
jgi:hypothetical protein